MRKSSLLSVLIFVSALFIDQYSKNWAKGLSTLRYNHGFIMGYFADLPDTLRIISLSSFAGFIFFLYICLILIIPHRARFLNYGLSLLMAGIIGNTLDKAIQGKTIDFIPFIWKGQLISFNGADVFLWMGTAMLVWMVFRRDKLIWYPENTRQNILVRPKEQYKVAMIFSVVAFCSSVVIGIFSYTFFNTMLKTLNYGRDEIMTTYFFTCCILTLLFCFSAFIAGIIISHKTAGPIYAFELFVNDLIRGKDRKFRLRDGDSYQDLENIAEKLREHFMNPKE